MAWGFFKNSLVADASGSVADVSTRRRRGYDGPALALATVFFALQIYCDFSGYSDIAIGAARVLGVQLMRELRAPVPRPLDAASSGGAGTSRCRPGSATTSTSRWAAAGRAGWRRSAT